MKYSQPQIELCRISSCDALMLSADFTAKGEDNVIGYSQIMNQEVEV